MTDNYGRSAETQSGSMMQRGGMGNEERTEKINFMAPKSRWVKQLTIIFGGGVLDFWFFKGVARGIRILWLSDSRPLAWAGME